MTADAAISGPPDAVVEVINASLRCFWLGCLGLMPVVGVPFALIATIRAVQLNRRYRDEWNPAKHYLEWGARLACAGLIGSALFAIGCYAIATAQSPGGSSVNVGFFDE